MLADKFEILDRARDAYRAACEVYHREWIKGESDALEEAEYRMEVARNAMWVAKRACPDVDEGAESDYLQRQLFALDDA